MVLKYYINNLTPFNEINELNIKNKFNLSIDSSKNNNYIYDLYMVTEKELIMQVSRKYPASIILFLNNNYFENLPGNVFYISPPFDFNNDIQIKNIIKLVQTNKDAYFRKIILKIKKEKNIKKIVKYLKKLGLYLKIIKLNDKINKKLILNNKFDREKKSGVIFKDKIFEGIYFYKKNKLYFFKSRWHNYSSLNNKLIIELYYTLKNKLFFKKASILKKTNIEIEVKEKFLGDHIGEGLFVIDLNGKITFSNNTFCKMFNCENRNLIGKKIREIIPSTMKFDFLKRWNNYSYEPISTIIESKVYTKRKYYNITYSPIVENNEIKNICGIIRDVTVQKKLEEEIKLSNLSINNVNKKLINVQNAIIMGFSKLSEYKDRETSGHLDRIQNYVKIMIEELYIRELFIDYKTKKNYLTEEYIEEITISSLLHDIGKVGIPDEILLKPDRLTKEEFLHMQLHTKIGGDTLKYLDDIVGELSFLAIAKEIAYFHHEKWNGMGYPYGLKHEEIPLSARVVSICDVYDALATQRPYKKAYSHEKTCEIIYDHAGTQFDPLITSVFSSIEKEFKQIRKKFSD